MPLDLSRRGFIGGLGALFIAAPAIVRASSIMPVKAMPAEIVSLREGEDICFLEGMGQTWTSAFWFGNAETAPREFTWFHACYDTTAPDKR